MGHDDQAGDAGEAGGDTGREGAHHGGGWQAASGDEDGAGGGVVDTAKEIDIASLRELFSQGRYYVVFQAKWTDPLTEEARTG